MFYQSSKQAVGWVVIAYAPGLAVVRANPPMRLRQKNNLLIQYIMEPLNLRNVLEIKSILDKCNETERSILDYVINVANKSINAKGLDKPCPLEVEVNIAPDLSDHSSDDDLEIIEDSSD